MESRFWSVSPNALSKQQVENVLVLVAAIPMSLWSVGSVLNEVAPTTSLDMPDDADWSDPVHQPQASNRGNRMRARPA